MKYKIDNRYVAMHTLQAIVGVQLGVFIFSWFFDYDSYLRMAIGAFIGCAVVLPLFLLPLKISVGEGALSFRDEASLRKQVIDLKDIADVKDLSTRFYNAVSITTKTGAEHTLHPAKCAEFIEAITFELSL